MKTTYITWIVNNKPEGTDIDNLPLESFRMVEARRPKEAAVLAGLRTGRTAFPWGVTIGVALAKDVGSWSRKIHKYNIHFDRTIGNIEVAK